MIFGHSDDISIAMTSHFMKFSGFWMARNYVEQRCRNIALVYTIVGMVLLGLVQVVELYYSRGDFGTCLYILCNVLSLSMSLFKILILLGHKKDFFQLIVYLQQKFLHGIYDVHEKTIVDACKRVCAFFICVFTCCAHATIFSYVVSPIVVNIGRNETDRVLPFQMRISLISLTPYFEITFALQVLPILVFHETIEEICLSNFYSEIIEPLDVILEQALFLYQVGVCYFCFDNLLCIINLHVSSQFRILQYRLENLQDANKEKDRESLITCKSHTTDKCYSIFKTCVQQHQALIAYCNKLEKVFSSFSLGQVLVFSSLICLGGYQVLMSNAPFATRLIFVFHIMGCTAQLFMFTYSCDCLIQDSTNIATAMYAAPWSRLPMDKDGRTLRRDLILVILRSRVPCCLTAHKFFPISLETYTGIMSTAMSYFTLLQGRTVDTT